MICVWPLVPNLKGFNALGESVVLTLGRRGWMTKKDANDAKERDEVQFMAGESPANLRSPLARHMEARKGKAKPKGTYNRADMAAVERT